MRRALFFALGSLLALSLVSIEAFSWGTDTAIHYGWVSAFDIDSSEDDVMYVALLTMGLPGDPEPGTWPDEDLVTFYVYRSEDHGHAWDVITEFFVLGADRYNLRTLQLVVGRDDRGDLLHIFFVDEDRGILKLWNLSVPSGETTTHSFGPAPSPGVVCFDVARSYFSLPDEYALALAAVTTDDRVHVWASSDRGAAWREVFSDHAAIVESGVGVIDLSWVPPLSFVLAYAGDLADEYSDEPLAQRLEYPDALPPSHTLRWTDGFGWADQPSGWSEPWHVMDWTFEGILIPGDAFTYRISGAYSARRLRDLFLVFEERPIIMEPPTRDVIYRYTSWHLEQPDAPEDWTPDERQSVSADDALRLDFYCMDMLSPRCQSGRYVYILQKWGRFLELLRADSEAVEGFPTSVIAFGMNDNEQIYDADWRWNRLAPKLVFSSYDPPDDCVGLAYSVETVEAATSGAGINLYYDGSCHGILPRPYSISSGIGSPILLEAAATAACAPGRSHEIQVSWDVRSCEGSCDVTIQILKNDAVLASVRSSVARGSEVLGVSLAEGGSVAVTVTAQSGSESWSVSQSLTLEPC